MRFGDSYRRGPHSSFGWFGIVQVVEKLVTLPGAIYNLYLVDIDVGRLNVRGAASGQHH